MPEMTFRTTYCRPIVDESGNQSSRVFKAGQTYNVEMTPEMKMLHERGNIYPANEKPPKEPPKTDPPINSARTDMEFNAMSEVIDRTIQQVIGMTPQQQAELARKRGWQHGKEGK